jgi:Flp pilus assembly protein TadG
MALTLVVMMGFAALGFDLAYVRLARLQMQNASDAAAHAAMVNLRITGNLSSARQTAVTVAAANAVLGKPVLLQGGDVVFGGWDFAHGSFLANTLPANAVTVNGRRSDPTASDGSVSLAFGRVLGFSEANVTRSSVGAFRIRDLVIEMDVTGSFLDNMDNAVRANVAMLDYMQSLNIPSDQIGLDVFVGKAQEVTRLQNLKNSYNAIRAEWWGDGMSSLHAGKRSGIAVCNKIGVDPAWPNHGWMPHCWDGGEPGFFAGTNQGAALKSGVDKLNAQVKNYETRVIVLVTDGSPMCCPAPQGGGCADGVTCADSGPLCTCAKHVAQYGRDMADYAATSGVDIFTVVFGNAPAGMAYGASLARGIGQSYNTPDSTQLQSILLDIAGRIPVALVR